ncbi:MAG: peptidoglycan-binding domain-containing protein [Methylococcaceae bacterium]
MASRIPGPLGVGANKPVIDKGTMALTNSPLPRPIGIEDTKVSSYSSSILESVGRGGRNLPKDVRTVQKLLNDTTLHSLAIDGIMGMNTLDAIKEFQERVVGMHRPDCRVDPNGRTFRMLVEYKPTKSTTFKHSLSGGTHIIEGGNGVQMVMLVRSRKEYFTDFIVREAKANGLKVVVNGSFIDLLFASSVSVLTGSDPLEASESTPLGRVIQDGRLLAGNSSTAKFSFSQNTCGVEKFSASLGNPPSSSCSAIGGIAPIIIDSLPYGAVNTYKAGVPSGAPLTGCGCQIQTFSYSKEQRYVCHITFKRGHHWQDSYWLLKL